MSLVQLLHVTHNAEHLIESCGRTCYKSTSCITAESYARFIRKLIESGHESVLEHASATFRISGVSRSFSHQLVRHRLASFSQESQRYVKSDSKNFVIPLALMDNIEAHKIAEDALLHAEQAYEDLIHIHKIKKEDARCVLPNATPTEIVVTMNFRELRHFFKLRLSTHAQAEIRDVACKMCHAVGAEAPNVFADLIKILEKA